MTAWKTGIVSTRLRLVFGKLEVEMAACFVTKEIWVLLLPLAFVREHCLVEPPAEEGRLLVEQLWLLLHLCRRYRS